MTQRTAFVTGASQGIGRECAKALAAAGAKVLAGARQQDKLAALVAEIRAAGGQAEAVALDVACAESIDRVFKQYAGDVDILVNNAGITRDGLAMRMADAAWDAVLATNLTGSFRCIKAVIRPMAEKTLGPYRQRHVGRRANRQRRASELRRLQSRADRPDQVAGAGVRRAQRHRQRRRPRLHRHSHDKRVGTKLPR